MVYLMAKTSGSKSLTFYFKPFTKSILSSDLDIHRTFYHTIFTGNAQAALSAILLTFCSNYFGVNQFNKELFFIFFNICFKNKHNPTQYTYLGCRKTNTTCFCKCVCHVVSVSVSIVPAPPSRGRLCPCGSRGC